MQRATRTQFECVAPTITANRNDQKPKKTLSTNHIQGKPQIGIFIWTNHKEFEQVTPRIAADAIPGNNKTENILGLANARSHLQICCFEIWPVFLATQLVDRYPVFQIQNKRCVMLSDALNGPRLSTVVQRPVQQLSSWLTPALCCYTARAVGQHSD